jgi:hypothetical protein
MGLGQRCITKGGVGLPVSDGRVLAGLSAIDLYVSEYRAALKTAHSEVETRLVSERLLFQNW